MSVLATFSAALEARDPHLHGHATRVTAFAEALARLIGWREDALETLRLGGSLHDLGKIVVDPAILRKPGPLTEAELTQIRRHPVAGARLIDRVAGLREARPYVLYHHERWDGTGYPARKAGDRIPLEARLLAVADAFDAMTSERAYRQPLTLEDALAEVERCAGTQFDPRLALTFLRGWEKGEFDVGDRGAAASAF